MCPSTVAGGAVTIGTTTVTPAGAGVSPAAPAAVPGVSGEQQCLVESRSRRRHSRSSSDGTDRRAKKRARRRSPSPGPSSRCRGRHYRSSLDSSEEDRDDASPPRSGRAHGGTPGGAGSSQAYDRSPRPGTSRSYARDDRYRSGAGRQSPAPSGAADDDRTSTFELVDFDRDDSFRSVLGLIRSFHGMEEPAGVPSARCKTSLASAYGLMSEVSPAFTLPASPLVRSLLDDTNLALGKFLEDQTVHGVLPVPGRRHRRYYRTSSYSFPGPYTVSPGVTSITLEKVSEAKKRSVALSASLVSSMETMLSGVCEVSSWLYWWLSTCGGFQDHLPVEVCADFERLMISGSRALEFLASQGCTTLGNLVLARRDSLLADVRSTVPVEEVACLRYSPLPDSVLALKGRDLASSREITTLLRSFSRSVDPVELRPPAWDVSLVLQSLTGAPYEPLRTCEERFLAQKTLFVLALASAKHIGELHALSYRVSHTRNWGEVSFSFVTGFVAKTQDPSSLAPRFEGFSVPALRNARKKRNGRLLCPVRAVRVYLDRTAPHRPRCERFFVTAGRSKKEIAKTTVSFWLRKTISRAYELSGTALPVPAP